MSVGSHGALHGGRRESALTMHAMAAVFNDAGLAPTVSASPGSLRWKPELT